MVLTEAKQQTVTLDGEQISKSDLEEKQNSTPAGTKIKEIIPMKEYRTVKRLKD